MRHLVIGVGSIGRRHVRNLLSIGEQEITVTDKKEDSLKAIRDAHPAVKTLTVGENINYKDYDAVYICTHPDTHIRFLDDALENGCHCFVEKPFSLTAEGIAPLVEKGREKGLKIMTGFNMRYLTLIQEMKRRLDAGIIGKVLSCRVSLSSYMPNWHPEEDYRKSFMAFHNSGGGALFDYVHGLDLAQWLVDPINTLYCIKKSALLEMETDDVAALVGTTSNGAVVSFYFDFIDRVHRKSVDIVGTEGTLIWEFSTQERLRQYSSKSGEWSEICRKADYDSCYVHQLKDFINSINKKIEVASDGYNGLSTTRLLDAARESNESGRRVTIKQ